MSFKFNKYKKCIKIINLQTEYCISDICTISYYNKYGQHKINKFYWKTRSPLNSKKLEGFWLKEMKKTLLYTGKCIELSQLFRSKFYTKLNGNWLVAKLLKEYL